MLGLIQAKLSGDCAPFLRMITALYNGMTGHEGRNSGDVSFPRPPVGHVGDERLARRREFARVHRLMDS